MVGAILIWDGGGLAGTEWFASLFEFLGSTEFMGDRVFSLMVREGKFDVQAGCMDGCELSVEACIEIMNIGGTDGLVWFLDSSRLWLG